MQNEYARFKILSIDAYREESIWIWNDMHMLEDGVYFHVDSLTPRKILRMMRNAGYLTDASKGRVRVEDATQGMGECFEIQDKSTGQPLLALSSVH